MYVEILRLKVEAGSLDWGAPLGLHFGNPGGWSTLQGFSHIFPLAVLVRWPKICTWSRRLAAYTQSPDAPI